MFICLPCTLNMLGMSSSVWIYKVLFVADRELSVSIPGKFVLIGTPFISEDGSTGSYMLSDMRDQGSAGPGFH